VDVPLTDLRFRCANCGRRMTDWVVTAKRIGPQAPSSDAQLGQPGHRIGADGDGNGAGQQGEGEHKGPH